MRIKVEGEIFENYQTENTRFNHEIYSMILNNLSTDLAKRIGALVEGNNIKINENMETSVRGLYACGDCTGGILQISKAVYEGAKAGLEIIKKEDKNVSN